MKEYKINFINHSCIKVENEKHCVLFDPWFFGKVFNNSWSLMNELGEEFIDFKKLTHIFITHEHPDHLSWPTLKKIRSKTDQKIWVLMGKRENDNVKDAITKMGFSFMYIPEDYRVKISDNFFLTNYNAGHDSGQMLEIDDKKIFNQNDCKFSDQKINYIKSKHGHLDALLYQFGLAGYYGNRDSHELLAAAQDTHINLIKKYAAVLKPDFYVPYASHIEFCKKYNNFLNKWQVSMKMLSERLNDMEVQYLYYGDELLFDKEEYTIRNEKSLEKWIVESEKEIEISDPKQYTESEIIEECNKFSSKYTSGTNTPNLIRINFFDLDTTLECNFEEKKFQFIPKDPKCTGILPAEEFISFLRFPWGADTLNITSCFDVVDAQAWKQLLVWKDQLYKR
tara:strand:+ start:8619 stop:9803 length:1185 start_codon:yes stop_codon:yes gene_type:complete